MGNMYEHAKTWNPFKGCKFDCSYCKPSFQAQAKRQKKNCLSCYAYKPHMHPERMSKIPKADIVFACGNGDVAFCPDSWIVKIMAEVRKRPEQTFYFQSKAPACFSGHTIPENVILVTTLETNIDQGYAEAVSESAPLPSNRYFQFKNLNHPRKVVTIEPIMDFGETYFGPEIADLNPEYVWIGYNTRSKQVQLPEPPLEKTLSLIAYLESRGIKVNKKYIPEK